MLEKVLEFIGGLRRYAVALAGIIYVVLTSLGVDVPEQTVTDTVTGAFDAWDKLLAVFATVLSLWSAWQPVPAKGTK